MSDGLDLNQLAVRMGEVKLLDLDYGYSIISKLNHITGEDTFKIEMTGSQMRSAFEALPASLRGSIDVTTLLTSDQVVETINDIEKSVRHMSEIEDRDVRAVESYMGVAFMVICGFCMIITVAYSATVADIKIPYTNYMSNAITALIENVYSRNQSPKEPTTIAPTNDTDAQ